MVPVGILDDVAILGIRAVPGGSRFKKTAGRMAGPLMLAQVAVETGMAPRGHVASTFMASGLGNAFMLPASALGGLVGGPVGEIVAGIAGYYLGDKIGHSYQAVVEAGQQLRRFNAGGDYRDSEVAYTMRQRASLELSSSLLNARQYLGKEALMFHE